MASLSDIYGSPNNDTLTGGSGADRLYGYASGESALPSGNDSLSGGGGNDTLYGGDGNDTLDGGAGSDSMIGGIGDDVYVVGSAGDVVTENTGEGTDLVQSSRDYTLGSNVENLTLTGSSDLDGSGNLLDNYMTGNSGDNNLSGGSGNDTLSGGSGNDTMIGGAGNDTYVVDRSGDVVTEQTGEGTDLVQSSRDYTLGSNVENLTLTGSSDLDGSGNSLDNYITGNSGNNSLSGGNGNDTLYGGDGNDTLDGGAGNDSMTGGDGNDTYVVDSSSDVVTENTGEGTDLVQSNRDYTLGSNVENLTLTGSSSLDGTGNTLDNYITGNSGNNSLAGGEGNDTLSGGNGNDILSGGNGNDSLDGGSGNDSMIGGDGNDIYVVDRSGDVITENTGEGTDLVQSSRDYTLGSNVENLTLTGSSDLDGSGNSLDNVITGNSGDNSLSGGDGNDTLSGGSDDDNLSGGNGDDSLYGGSGSDTLIGGAGNDTYVIDDDHDKVTEISGGGIDLVQSSRDYTLGSNVENLTLMGSSDLDGSGNSLDNVITGNSGDNSLSGGDGNDTLDGGDGNDTLAGGNGHDSMIGGIGRDSMSGGDGNDTLSGGDGNDTLSGGNGNDMLDGGAGNDSMSGGAGDDTYVVDHSGDNVTESHGHGTDLVLSRITYTLGSNVENLTLTGSENLNGTGNGLDNYITGNSGNNSLSGGAGNDTLNGGAGNDSMSGGTGDDIYVVDNENDVVTENLNEGADLVQSSISYTLGDNVENLLLTGSENLNGTGNGLDNYLTGNSGDNSLFGGDGNDTLSGGSGNDTLDGGTGSDSMIGGTGDDTYVVDNDNDVVTEKLNEGTDLVKSSISYTLGDHVENLTLTGTSDLNGTGNGLDNYITGNTGNNSLSGGDGNDTLSGGDGNDTLSGGNDNDTLIGGDGNDTAVFSGNYEDYTITYDSLTSTYTVTDNRPGVHDGVDSVSFVENFSFADGTKTSVPAFSSPATVTAAENQTAVETVVASSVLGGISYSITGGADKDKFSIDSTTGELTFVSAPDYEHPTDTGSDNSYEVIVTATDAGSNVDQTVSVSVTDVNEAPTAVVLTGVLTDNKIAENSDVTGGVKVADIAVTDDALGVNTLGLSGTDASSFEIRGTALYFIGSSLDFELKPSYSVTVNADDATIGAAGTVEASHSFTLTVTDVNEAPTAVVLTGVLTDNKIAENSDVTGGIKVADIAVTDDALGVNTLGLSGTDASSFEIRGTALYFIGSSPDFELKPSYSVTVNADDATIGAAGTVEVSQSFTLTVTNINDNPVSAVTDTNGAGNSVAENAAPGTAVGVTAFATDADTGATISYSLTDNAGGRFSIDGTTGVITVAGGLDYESAQSHTVTVLATSSDGSTNSGNFTIAVTNINDNPVSAVTDTNGAGNSVAENAVPGTVVGVTAFATDADTGATISYSLTDNAGGRFSIDGTTGVITVAGGLDYESAQSHTVTVLATSSDGSTNSGNFTIAVTNINDNPVSALTDANGAGNSVVENAASGTAVGVTAFATDADTGSTISYSLINDAAGFAINSTTGVITVAGGVDYEIAQSHTVTVLATSSDGSTNSGDFTIAVTNTNDNLVSAISDTNGAINFVEENSASGTSVGVTAFAMDGDSGATITYSLTDSAGGKFAIDSTTGILTVAGALDYESAHSHTVTVLATSSDGSTNSGNFTIGVIDVNELPVDTTPPIVSAYSPADGDTGVALGRDILVIFSENIQLGSGLVEIHTGSVSGPVLASYDASSSPELTIQDSISLRINPTFDLTSGTQYFVTLAAGTIKDITGNNYTGTTGSYGFTTEVAMIHNGAGVTPDIYSGPATAAGGGAIQYQFLGDSTNEVLQGTAYNDFINLGAGDDAINAGGGDDVIDGGLGSNFLTGGPGTDIFFCDGRGGGITWSTITDWEAGEQLSIWGWMPGTSRILLWQWDGAPGYQGLTMHADLNGDGTIDTSVTFTGITSQSQLPTPLESVNLLWFQ